MCRCVVGVFGVGKMVGGCETVELKIADGGRWNKSGGEWVRVSAEYLLGGVGVG